MTIFIRHVIKGHLLVLNRVYVVTMQVVFGITQPTTNIFVPFSKPLSVPIVFELRMNPRLGRSGRTNKTDTDSGDADNEVALSLSIPSRDGPVTRVSPHSYIWETGRMSHI